MTDRKREPRISTKISCSHYKLLDQRLTGVQYVNTAFPMPAPASRADWERHAARVRRRALIAAGLCPEPARTPLRARVAGRIEMSGCAIEKVRFQSRPGLLVTGNLYRPLDAKGKRPAVLCPHGHWKHGRIETSENGSVPARCVMLARLGFVVFSYDMVGYNDSFQIDHRREDRDLLASLLYGVGPFGMQLWNSIRALDFLESLPDVDSRRIGCTGTSGGATQTYFLGLVDDRVRVLAPVCMVSGHYQGGCECEAGPFLHLGRLTTVDVVGALAPRPVFLPSVTQDWTNQLPDVEIPALRRVYALYGAEEKLGSVHFDAPHNYNKDTREHVYAWFLKHLARRRDVPERIGEPAFRIPTARHLRLFQEGAFPKDLKRGQALIDHLIAAERKPFRRPPGTAGELRGLRRRWREVYCDVLGARPPEGVVDMGTPRPLASETADVHAWGYLLGRPGRGEQTPALHLTTRNAAKRAPAVLVVCGQGKAALFQNGRPRALLASLLAAGVRVLAIDMLGLGETSPLLKRSPLKPDDPLTYAFNPSLLAHRVQEILTALAVLRQNKGSGPPALIGTGAGAVAALCARPLAGRLRATAVDLTGCRVGEDSFWMGDCYHPLIRKLGDVRGAIALARGEPLLLAGADATVARWARAVYRLQGRQKSLRVLSRRASAGRITEWVAGSS